MKPVMATVGGPRGSLGEETDPVLVRHQCPVDGRIAVEAGQPCNWCDGIPGPAEFHRMQDVYRDVEQGR